MTEADLRIGMTFFDRTERFVFYFKGFSTNRPDGSVRFLISWVDHERRNRVSDAYTVETALRQFNQGDWRVETEQRTILIKKKKE